MLYVHVLLLRWLGSAARVRREHLIKVRARCALTGLHHHVLLVDIYRIIVYSKPAGMSEEEGGSSSGSSTPEPPEPMDVEEEASQEGLTEAVRDSVPAQGKEEEEEELDVKLTAKEFAEFLVVDSKQDVSTE